ncbi:ABC transporter substrate-binding protein [Paenibacillus camelliae]|uniref:ABC transporter substrate-binding protein n=1 Tax=Paenibacillus camelliae TaxID=512410 RepID=UPI00203F46CF|nr:ABC transporter substrate-binding protein [Paenibacillus camelliae]MCM3634004.1 ABC transporter substrate-binding protein [Paenibacillus camelliae]
MIKSRLKWSLAASLTFILMFASACGNGSGGNNTSNNVNTETGGANKSTSTTSSASQASSSSTKSSEPVNVLWWHSMGGELGAAVTELVAQFNSSQSDIIVEEVYQGSYDESLNKMKASMDSKSGPALIQVYEIGSRFMIDSGATTPIQTFIDAEQYDLSLLEENITNYYSFDGQLHSMPFNTSNPILYYNKDMFAAAGLDPDKAPATFEEVAEYAEKLTQGGQAGASFAIYGWFMEQFFANQGSDYLNNGNGRTSAATESNLNNEVGVETLTWWKELVDQGHALNLGRATADTKKAFLAGQVAMTLDSTASLRGIVDAAEGQFEVGTGFLPKAANAAEGGVVVGGASLWIMNNKSQEEQQAAWEFIKFLAKPETQAYWHVNTGYFPITKAAYEETLVSDNLAKYPQFQTAVDQLHASKPSTASTGAVMGVFPEARQIVESAIEEALNDVKSPQDALTSGAQQITDKISTYNKTVQ